MSKTITKTINEGNDNHSILTVNEEKKRFHVLIACNDGLKKTPFKLATQRVKTMKDKGYTLVPFEDVFDHMGESEIYDKDNNLISSGIMDLSENK